MKPSKREEIMDRYYGVIAEKSLYERGNVHYERLSHIAKLIINELPNGKHPRHIMFTNGSGYDYRCD